MIDPIDFFEHLTDKANTTQLCDRCYEFHYGRKDYTNLLKKSENAPCCVYVILEHWNIQEVYELGDFESSKAHADLRVHFFFGVDAGFTRQMYNEMDDSDIEESKWYRYLSPLQDCLDAFFNDNFCETLFPAAIKEKNIEALYNYKDQNLDGFKVSATIRKWYA